PVVDFARELSEAVDVVGLVFEMLEDRAKRKAPGKSVGAACLPALVLPAGGRGTEQRIERLEVVVLLVSHAGVERTVLVGHVRGEELRFEARALRDPGRGRAERGVGGAVGKARRYPAPCRGRALAYDAP